MERKGFWMDVDGEKIHVQGDPNMSQDELDMLVNIIKAAMKHVEQPYPEDEGRECEMCGKPIVYGSSNMCPSCKQVWDS